MRALSPLLFLTASFLFCHAARANGLVLTLDTPLDISGLGHGSVGDLAFDRATAKLWMSDGTTNGHVFQLNPITGALISEFATTAIPGFDGGPDALAVGFISPASRVFVFSPFGESEGGTLSVTGALVADFGTARNATGADRDLGGNWWIASGITAGGGSVLQRIDPDTGAVLASVPVIGLTSRLTDIAFDPFSGALYGLAEDRWIHEIDNATGAILSTTDISAFFPSNSVTGGLAFTSSGAGLFVVMGTGAAAQSIVRFQRQFTENVCDGSGSFGACPCGNAGSAGHGCANSVVPAGGSLTSRGISRISADNLVLIAEGLPTTTTALFFQGTASLAPTAPVFGDGLRCVGGTVIRLDTKSVGAGGTEYPIAGDPPIDVVGLIPSGGGVRFYQLWYRNAAAFCTASTFNLTNGVRADWRP